MGYIQQLTYLLMAIYWSFPSTDADTTITKLFETIQGAQVLRDSDFSIFPFSWEMKKGMYPNDVRLNFHGGEQYYLVRDKFKVPDNNMFTPAWITSCLIEAYVYGSAPKPSADQIKLALNVINTFRNRNVAHKNSEMTFWLQKINKTANYYQSSPNNLFELLRFPDYLPQKLIEEILDIVGLKDIEHVLKMLFQSKDYFALAFHIPPDFDDTFVNIGLGSLLTKFQEAFSEGHQTWTRQNDNLTSVFDSVKKYAYRPFSATPSQSTIDPRTYMYLRTFLEQADANNQDVALVTTWLQDTEEVTSLFAKGVAMPFNVNNVDVTVSANFVFGVIMCVTTGVCGQSGIHMDGDLQQIFMNTTTLIAHELATNLSSRPDLALTYYPSKYEFYWYVSRSYAYLNRFYKPGTNKAGSKDTDQMFTYALQVLRPVLRQEMSQAIINSVKTDLDGSMYIDNFLGDDDKTLCNKTIRRAEDRIFTTAVSVNALLNTWTLWQNNTLVWENDTPSDIRGTVDKLVMWLGKNALSDKYKPWNTFFSGSGKSSTTMPYFYPTNRREYFNGTTFDDKKFPSDVRNIIGMKGVVTHSDYDAMLKRPHFGHMTLMTFNGYNSEEGGFFPFWTCDSYTYAVSLLALSQYDNINNRK